MGLLGSGIDTLAQHHSHGYGREQNQTEGRLESSCVARGNKSGAAAMGNNMAAGPQRNETALPDDPATPLLGDEEEQQGLESSLYAHVHSDVLHSRPKVEATQVPSVAGQNGVCTPGSTVSLNKERGSNPGSQGDGPH